MLLCDYYCVFTLTGLSFSGCRDSFACPVSQSDVTGLNSNVLKSETNKSLSVAWVIGTSWLRIGLSKQCFLKPRFHGERRRASLPTLREVKLLWGGEGTKSSRLKCVVPKATVTRQRILGYPISWQMLLVASLTFLQFVSRILLQPSERITRLTSKFVLESTQGRGNLHTLCIQHTKNLRIGSRFSYT